MSKTKKYPKRVYAGITSDPDTWGMCCSEEMARKCAEEHYNNKRTNRFVNMLYTIPIVLIALTGIIILAEKTAEQTGVLPNCNICHQLITSDEYVDNKDNSYHKDCVADLVSDVLKQTPLTNDAS